MFTVSEAIGTCWSDVCQHQPSGRPALSQGKMVVESLGATARLPDLTDASITRFVARRRATVSNATVNRALDLLDRAIRHMPRVHKAVFPADLDIKAHKLREPIERVRELTRAEQDALLRRPRPDLHPLVKMALMTGARPDTLCGLRWTDVDRDERRILFRLKGGGTMRFPISREMMTFLTAMPRAETAPAAHLVLTYEARNRKEWPQRPIPPSGGGLMKEFRQALGAAGIVDFRFHDLPHTFASRMLRQTGNLKLVSRLLGYSQIETKSRYAHVLDADMVEAVGGCLVMGVSRRKSRCG